MMFIQLLVGLFIFIITYLAFIIFSPWLKVEPQLFMKKSPHNIPSENREDFTCNSEGETLHGWFYKSAGYDKKPCIIMSHGFCGTKEGILEKYAMTFQEKGFHVITYDFRYFGQSSGEPRQLYGGKYQLEDLTHVIAYAKSRDDVNENKLIVWGTSAGAHLGIMAASTDDTIAGVIGQCGAYDTDADAHYQVKQIGYGHFIKLFVHAQRDKGRSRFGLSPHMITAYGRPKTTAMFNLPGVFENVEAISENNNSFINTLAARSLFSPKAGNTGLAAKSVRCPVLFLRCLKDTLVAPNSQAKVVENLGPLATEKDYDIDHFEIYKDEHFKRAIRDQIDFIKDMILNNDHF